MAKIGVPGLMPRNALQIYLSPILLFAMLAEFQRLLQQIVRNRRILLSRGTRRQFDDGLQIREA